MTTKNSVTQTRYEFAVASMQWKTGIATAYLSDLATKTAVTYDSFSSLSEFLDHLKAEGWEIQYRDGWLVWLRREVMP